VKSILLLVNCIAVYALAGLTFTSYAQGLVEAPIALTPNVDCPNGCKWSLSILNSTGSDFAVGELAIVIESPLTDNLVTTLPRRLKDGSLISNTTLLVCSVTINQIREKIKVPMNESSAVQIEVPPGHLVHSRIIGEISKIKEMPLLCWSAVDAETGGEMGSDCVHLRRARNVVPLAEDSLIPGDLCDTYPGGDCVCPYD
jgi:hypothetical protein